MHSIDSAVRKNPTIYRGSINEYQKQWDDSIPKYLTAAHNGKNPQMPGVEVEGCNGWQVKDRGVRTRKGCTKSAQSAASAHADASSARHLDLWTVCKAGV
jgi:hypothetical protein